MQAGNAKQMPVANTTAPICAIMKAFFRMKSATFKNMRCTNPDSTDRISLQSHLSLLSEAR
tara:strand:+ start:286 stop:468 length:183 start_codon:yes stop_codon:yes gene_type:complete